MEERGGEIKFKFPPQKSPHRIQDLGEKRGHICKEPGEEVMASQVLRVLVAGQPLPMAGRPRVKKVKHNYWSATSKRWPPMCAQHNYVIEPQKK